MEDKKPHHEFEMGAREVAGAVIVLPFVKFQYVTNLTVREAPPLLLQPCAPKCRRLRGTLAFGSCRQRHRPHGLWIVIGFIETPPAGSMEHW